jgi:hypothetical protein
MDISEGGRHMSRYVRALMISLISIVLGGFLFTAAAGIPQKINYQGRLTDAATGEPLVGEHEVSFSIYDAPSDGSELWSQTQAATADSTGVVSAILGSTNPIDVAFDGPVWLEVEVEDDDEILAPRREIVSVP